MIIYAQIKNGELCPENNSDLDNFKKIKPDTTYKFVVTQPRNVNFHRKYFSLLNLAFDNQEKFNNIDDFRAWSTIKSGYYKRIPTPGADLYLPQSINFASMDNLEFEQFYSKVLDVFCDFLDTSKEDIIQNLADYL